MTPILRSISPSIGASVHIRTSMQQFFIFNCLQVCVSLDLSAVLPGQMQHSTLNFIPTQSIVVDIPYVREEYASKEFTLNIAMRCDNCNLHFLTRYDPTLRMSPSQLLHTWIHIHVFSCTV